MYTPVLCLCTCTCTGTVTCMVVMWLPLFYSRSSNLFLNLFSLMQDANVPDIAIEPDKTVKKVQVSRDRITGMFLKCVCNPDSCISGPFSPGVEWRGGGQVHGTTHRCFNQRNDASHHGTHAPVHTGKFKFFCNFISHRVTLRASPIVFLAFQAIVIVWSRFDPEEQTVTLTLHGVKIQQEFPHYCPSHHYRIFVIFLRLK